MLTRNGDFPLGEICWLKYQPKPTNGWLFTVIHMAWLDKSTNCTTVSAFRPKAWNRKPWNRYWMLWIVCRFWRCPLVWKKRRKKEREISFGNVSYRWNAKNNWLRLWSIFNGIKTSVESTRGWPFSNWTKLDIWHYIHRDWGSEVLFISPLEDQLWNGARCFWP